VTHMTLRRGSKRLTRIAMPADQVSLATTLGIAIGAADSPSLNPEIRAEA